jgi:two-component system nitrogen regulation sensor histidine kinase NtrY
LKPNRARNQFARLPTSNPQSGSLNKVINESLVLFASAPAKVEFTADEALPSFIFDPDQMRRIINNLVDNAIAATAEKPGDKGGGHIVIRTHYDNVLKIARIEIEDDGPGIPANLRERIFEPYVTTKQQGTGLGLAIVKRMVEDHHGFIRAFSDGESYTRFVIELPVVEIADNQKIVRSKEKSGEEWV